MVIAIEKYIWYPFLTLILVGGCVSTSIFLRLQTKKSRGWTKAPSLIACTRVLRPCVTCTGGLPVILFFFFSPSRYHLFWNRMRETRKCFHTFFFRRSWEMEISQYTYSPTVAHNRKGRKKLINSRGLEEDFITHAQLTYLSHTYCLVSQEECEVLYIKIV